MKSARDPRIIHDIAGNVSPLALSEQSSAWARTSTSSATSAPTG